MLETLKEELTRRRALLIAPLALAGIAVLVVIALFGLFRLQGKFRQRYPDGEKEKSPSGVDERSEEADSLGNSAESPSARPAA